MEISRVLLQIWEFLQQWYWIPLLLIYGGVLTTILLGNGNPTKTKAWILVIIFIPIVGIILYYFFGQKFKKEKYFKSLDIKSTLEIKRNWDSFNLFSKAEFDFIRENVGVQSEVFQLLNHTYSSPPMLNNKVTLLKNGEEKFPKFLDAIRNAKHHIHLEYYIFNEDDIGNEIINLLIKKSEEGVIVRITTDDFGSPKFNKNALKRFENTNVNYQTFLPVHFNSLADSNFRNHRKILIVDGKTAFIGGINISDKYINNGKFDLYWRDTSVMIEGDAVNFLQLRFWMNWAMVSGEKFIVNDYDYLPIQPNNIGKSLVGFAFTSPGSEVQSAVESMILAIFLAKKKVRLTTPYFIPSEEFDSALKIAMNRGVEVELILPKKGDSLIVQEASMSFLIRLMKQGLKVYLYEKGFIHAKTISIDEDIAFVGTVNLDNRSFYINFEITTVIHDVDFIKELNSHFEIDKVDSSILTYNLWKNQPIYRRAFASICRLLAPLL